jgi:hypothetical protein
MVIFLISNSRCVLNVVCFLLGDLAAPEVHMTMFRNTLSVPSSQASRYTTTYTPKKMEQIECSETLAFKLQMPVNHPDESIQHGQICQLE